MSTVVIGAGQAGLALSYHFARAGHEHVLLEQGRIGERWRSERWESLALLSPNWANELPGGPAHEDPDGFLTGAAFADYLESYARSFGAPVAEGVTVLAVEQSTHGFRVATDSGVFTPQNVVVATGHSALPFVPATAATGPDGVVQVHSSRYRSPGALPPGAVLVVGAGPSGQQIALELVRAGRQVFLSAGAHARVPRRYRGRDIWAWLDALGRFDDTVDDVGEVAARRPTPSVTLTGVDGGEPLDLGVLQRAGAVLGGRLTGFTGHHALFAADLPDTIRTADESMHALLAEIDRHIADTGVEAEPPEEVPAVPVEPGISSLDLTAAGVSAIVWATGYRRSYPWLHAPVLTPRGELEQRDGVTRMAGLYSLGLRFQHRRSSHQIRGVGRDAALLAARILGTPAPARRLHARPRPTRARRAMAAALAA